MEAVNGGGHLQDAEEALADVCRSGGQGSSQARTRVGREGRRSAFAEEPGDVLAIDKEGMLE